MKQYLPRIYDEILSFKLKSKGAVLVVGPKWCGKSTTALRFAKSTVYMQDKKNQEQNIALAKCNPDIFLEGETPKLIDEWQIIPFIWDSIRFEVDQRDEFGQFILTGSATPVEEGAFEHTGIGRITEMIMRPMSLYESKDSSGKVSLKELFDGNCFVPSKDDKSIKDYAFYLCRGGWPKAVNQEEKIALQQAIDYYDALVSSEMRLGTGKARDPERVKLLLRSYSRNISTQASNTTIKKDMLTNDSSKLDEDTIISYVNSLKNLYVVEELIAWNPNIRSKAAIRTSNTREFVDPSIACAALGLGPNDLINDLRTFGLLFESMCIRDLRVYADSLDANVYHYRDSSGLEADAVIHLRNGEYALIEIKLADPDLINEGAANLIKLSKTIDVGKMKKPKFLMVITGTNYAYVREDGVYVVPIGMLKN